MTYSPQAGTATAFPMSCYGGLHRKFTVPHLHDTKPFFVLGCVFALGLIDNVLLYIAIVFNIEGTCRRLRTRTRMLMS